MNDAIAHPDTSDTKYWLDSHAQSTHDAFEVMLFRSQGIASVANKLSLATPHDSGQYRAVRWHLQTSWRATGTKQNKRSILKGQTFRATR